MINDFDVIIVGASAAGLACAQGLKSSGLSVLICEKNEELDSKICAGGLVGFADQLTLSKLQHCQFQSQTIFMKDVQHHLDMHHSMLTISRRQLLNYQLEKIKSAPNIQLMKDCCVLEIKDNAIVTRDNRIYHFRHLVGADGSASRVRKACGIKSENYMGLVVECERTVKDLQWYVDPSKMKSGYLWVFPHYDHCNVGIYYHPRHTSLKQAKTYLHEFIYKYNLKPLNVKVLGAPINTCYQGHQFGTIHLVGDAAGLAFKLTGEGLPAALISGAEIAKKIVDASYQQPQLKKVLKLKQRQDMLTSLYENATWGQSLILKVFVSLMKHKSFQRFLWG